MGPPLYTVIYWATGGMGAGWELKAGYTTHWHTDKAVVLSLMCISSGLNLPALLR